MFVPRNRYLKDFVRECKKNICFSLAKRYSLEAGLDLFRLLHPKVHAMGFYIFYIYVSIGVSVRGTTVISFFLSCGANT